MSSGSETKASQPAERIAQSEPKKPSPEAERPPQTEEVLCTICGMRSCWR